MKLMNCASSEPLTITVANSLLPRHEKMKIKTRIKLPTLMKAGMVCRKELKMM